MMARSATALSFLLLRFAADNKYTGTESGTANIGWVGESSRRNPSRI